VTLYLLLSTLAAPGFYLACAHQRLWATARAQARMVRTAVRAATALGPWAGVFASLTALMLVLLPYPDAWWSSPRGDHHVG
jgi:hypothetical protein